MSRLSRVRRASGGSNGPAALTTLLSANGTTRDLNALQSGAGLRDVGEVITCTLTRQATVRDGHQEGILNYQPFPAAWRGDGTQQILFVVDQITLGAVNVAILMGFGVLADIGANQAAQVGSLRGLYNTSGAARMMTINATSITALALNLTLGRMYLRYAPNYNTTLAVLRDGMIEPWSRESDNSLKALSSGLCEVAGNTMTAPRICFFAGTTTTAVAEHTVGARIRYAITDFLPLVNR